MPELQAGQLIKMNKNKKPTTSKLGRQKIELNEKNDIIAKSDYSEPNWMNEWLIWPPAEHTQTHTHGRTHHAHIKTIDQKHAYHIPQTCSMLTHSQLTWMHFSSFWTSCNLSTCTFINFQRNKLIIAHQFFRAYIIIVNIKQSTINMISNVYYTSSFFSLSLESHDFLTQVQDF